MGGGRGGCEGGVLWPQFGLRSIIFIPVLGLEDGDFLFLCLSDSSLLRAEFMPPPTPLPRLTPHPHLLAVALAARFSSSSAASSRTISTNVDISGKDIKRLHHFFFFFFLFAIISVRVSSHVTITSCGLFYRLLFTTAAYSASGLQRSSHGQMLIGTDAA